MDNQDYPARHIFRYKHFQIDKCQRLGRGAYGAVYKAKCDQLPCAAKVLHPTVVDPMDPGTDKILERFGQECSLLENIRHPSIVQYLAMALDPESGLPVLLMELLDESLTKMLERSQQSLAYYIQVNICHDIALAIAYLHSNGIIHRDLSSNNVLIISGRRAKVTDFGMSKLADAALTMTPLTMCPGTLAYMPPEALREPPRYTKKLDCFSEGVIMIQMCTRLWPEPGPRTHTVQDSRSPMGVTEMPVSEMERRKNHIDLIDPTHPLLSIAVDCLHFQEVERPSSEELCQRLDDLKGSAQYAQSIEQQQNELQAKEDQIAMLTRQLHESIKSNQRESLTEKQSESYDYKQPPEKSVDEQKTASREGVLSKQLKEQKQAMLEMQQTNFSLRREVEQLKKQLSQQLLQCHTQTSTALLDIQRLDGERQEEQPVKLTFLPKSEEYKPQLPSNSTLTLNWVNKSSKAPFDLRRGAVVVDGNVAYFMGSDGQACSYNAMNKKWKKYPKCSYQQCGLAIINGRVTAIGGCKDNFVIILFSNKLLSLCEGDREKWEEIFPPMPTKREGVTAITFKKSVIVAGGTVRSFVSGVTTALDIVEVMDTKTRVWSKVASLPHSFHSASVTISEDRLYMLGGLDDAENTRSVLTCSLADLIQSTSASSSVWQSLADAPVNRSTCATVDGQLITLGGLDDRDNPTAAIHKFNPVTNSWSIMGYMPTVKFDCLMAIFPQNNEIMLVGGCTKFLVLNIAEFANFF